MIQSTGVDGCEEFGEVVVEVVEDLIGRRALLARRCWWLPELHTSIVFEDAFDDKLFSQQYKEKQRSRTCARPPSQPTERTCLTPTPPPAPGTALNASPGAGVKAGPERAKGHPEGLALTPARTAPHSRGREQQQPSVSVPFDKLRAHCSPFDKLRAQGFARPSTSSGHRALLALRQAQGTGLCSPFDKLRAQGFARPSTSSGHRALLALRQAQGTGLCSPFDKLRAHRY